jgi:hypothetical protein
LSLDPATEARLRTYLVDLLPVEAGRQPKGMA